MADGASTAAHTTIGTGVWSPANPARIREAICPDPGATGNQLTPVLRAGDLCEVGRLNAVRGSVPPETAPLANRLTGGRAFRHL